MSDATDDVDWFDFGAEDTDYQSYKKPAEQPPVKVGGLKCIRESDKALLVETPAKTRRWIPKGQICPGGNVTQPGDVGELYVTKWLFDKWAEEDASTPQQIDNLPVELPGCVCLRESAKAIQIKLPDGREEWFPLSQIEPTSEVLHDGDSGTLKCSKWIAGQKHVGDEA